MKKIDDGELKMSNVIESLVRLCLQGDGSDGQKMRHRQNVDCINNKRLFRMMANREKATQKNVAKKKHNNNMHEYGILWNCDSNRRKKKFYICSLFQWKNMYGISLQLF